MYSIGVDSGTQGTKVLVIDFSGKVHGRGYASHRSIEGLKAGESEQDPLIWIKAFEEALANALKESAVDPSKILSLGVSGQQHGFVPLDKNGSPIRPAKLWNDTSTVEETEFIINKLGGKELFTEKLGIQLAVGFTASKILWLKRKERENFNSLSAVLLPHNYLNYYLTDKLHMEYGDASGTGLMDIRALTWHEEAVKAVDKNLPEFLPPLSHPSEPVGYMNKKIADHLGLGKVLVSSGGGDNMMGAIGTGNVKPGTCTLSLGTSGTIYSYFSQPFYDPLGEIAAFCDSTGGWLPLLCTMNVTNTTEYLKNLLKLSNEDLERTAAEAPPGSEHLVFLPFIDGERVPVLPSSSGVFFGITKNNYNSSCMARSIMEGTIFNLGYGLSRMKALGLKPEEMRATGGGAKNTLWLQIVADIFKTPVVTLKEEEAAGFGAAIQSIWNYRLNNGEKVKISDITDELVETDTVMIEPQKENFPIYDLLQQRFNSLWKTLEDEFAEHRLLAERHSGD
jgi:xylulokinase